MDKTVEIVTIPIEKDGWDKGDIVKDLEDDELILVKSSIKYSQYWKAQQLLVLSDVIDDDKDFGKAIIYNTKNHSLQVCGVIDEETAKHDKKVIASYPHLLNTLPISKETVQAWIDAGRPDEMVFFYDGEPNNYIIDFQGNLLLEFPKQEHQCAHCGVMTTQPDEECYKAPQEKGTVISDEVINMNAIRHADNMYNSWDKSNDTAMSENQLWENAIRDYGAGYEQCLKDLGLK